MKTETARSWFNWLITNGSYWRVWPVPLASVDVMSPSRYHYWRMTASISTEVAGRLAVKEDKSRRKQ